ncbi:MAG: lamin tail domain-containing protein [Sphingobacteriales bacterium]|nr:lamin tail domain-containing protein [Sphingobacteriales bacterium]
MKIKGLKLTSLCILLCCVFTVKAQLNENFNDGDYTANPAWNTSAVSPGGDWIINTSQQLQSNDTVANSSFYISTINTLATSVQWEFYSQITFNPSSANYIDVYLIASASDITATGTTGFFVRIGNTTDEISLYRKDAGGVITKIIDGADGILNTSSNTMKIKVVRDAANNWTLFRDLSGTGNSYSSEGSVTDANYVTSAFFGILIKQSTKASFAQRHFFDDIVISNYVPDITPPALVSASAISSTAVDVLFNETVDATTAQTVTNYSASNGLGNPVSAIRDASNTSLVHLSFSTTIPNGVNCTLTVNGVQDIAGNAISNGTASFSFYTPQQYDVVIDELIADPAPQVGLPNAEWIELKNTSGFPINLSGWKIGDASGIIGPLPNYILKPDSFVIVCTGSAVPALSVFGKTISVTSFPSLDNTGETLSLLSGDGTVIHAVAYSDSWYQNPIKKDGGWTLEMIDTKNPCTGSGNWKESNDASGGTPGRKNSVDGNNKDATAPGVLRAYASNATTIVLLFDEPLNNAKAAVTTSYSISDGIGTPVSALPVAPLFDRVILSLNTSLQTNKVYTITVSGVTDCGNNTIGTKNNTRVGLASASDSLDAVVNEILFNPKSGGYDYVELYNRSNKILDFNQLYLANRNSAAQIANLKQISTETLLFFPGDYIVITESTDWVKNNYLVKNPENFIELSSLPSYNDDSSNVVIYNINGKIVDEFAYSDKWHFALINNTEGVALERIDYNGKTQTKENWHSAATIAGYGTPTYQNSQFRIDQQVQGEIKLTPDVFSPDNDGFDDFLTINYQFPERGYVANITIFDASGRPIRVLQKNALCTTSGYFRWDGLNDKLQKVPVGIYVVYTEIFNLQGKAKKFKNTTVVARKF